MIAQIDTGKTHPARNNISNNAPAGTKPIQQPCPPKGARGMSGWKGPAAWFLTDNDRLDDGNEGTPSFEIGLDDKLYESTGDQQRRYGFAEYCPGIATTAQDFNSHLGVPDRDRLINERETVKKSIEKSGMRQMVNRQKKLGIQRIQWFEAL